MIEEKIFSWKEYKNWEKSFTKFIKKILPSNFLTQLSFNISDIYSDYAGPYEEYIHDEYDNYYFELEFQEYFTKNYSHILTYHACRPINLNSYYEKGLLVLNSNDQHQYFFDTYLKENNNVISINDVENATKEIDRNYRENKLYLALDDRTIISEAGHYLIYGSEYLLCLAGILSHNHKKDIRSYLRKIGIPTIFKIKLSIERLHESDINYLFPKLFRMWVYNKLNDNFNSCAVDFSFSIKESLPPETIIDHFHPDEIRDYHNGGKIYVYKTNSYKVDESSI